MCRRGACPRATLAVAGCLPQIVCVSSRFWGLPRLPRRAIILQYRSAQITVFHAGIALWKMLSLVTSNACEPLILFVWLAWLLHRWDKNTIALVLCTVCPGVVHFWLALWSLCRGQGLWGESRGQALLLR